MVLITQPNKVRLAEQEIPYTTALLSVRDTSYAERWALQKTAPRRTARRTTRRFVESQPTIATGPELRVGSISHTESNTHPHAWFSRKQWMCHRNKLAFGLWGDRDHPDANPEDDARNKWSLSNPHITGSDMTQLDSCRMINRRVPREYGATRDAVSVAKMSETSQPILMCAKCTHRRHSSIQTQLVLPIFSTVCAIRAYTMHLTTETTGKNR